MSRDLDLKFIGNIIESQQDTRVFLSNGVRLDGKILEQDDVCFTMTLILKGKADTKVQLVYKNMVATVSPS